MEGSLVRDDEHYLRWIFDPRHICRGILKENFISLRGAEEGISGQIFERVTTEEIYEVSSIYSKKNKNYGFAMAMVEDIRGIAREKDVIDVVLTESPIPAHAEIRFNINDCPVIGNTPHPKMSYYLLKLTELLSKTIIVYNN